MYSYDRRVQGSVPNEICTLVSYKEGSGFGARQRTAVRTKRGWLGLEVHRYRQDIGGKPIAEVDTSKVETAAEAGMLEILAEGVKPGGRFTYTAQLEGLGPGSVVRSVHGTWQKRSDGKWDKDDGKPAESKHFDSAIELGLELVKAT